MKYHPVEMIAAMLNSVMGISEKVAHYIKFAESQGIQVLPPDINHSYPKFTVNGESIRFGLAAIKNVGMNVVESIVSSRDKKGGFSSLEEFVDKIDLSSVNKRAVESLIKSGALDSFGVFRSKLLAVFEKVIEGVSAERKRNIEGQISLFALGDDKVELPKVKYPEIKEFNKKNLLSMEKEMTGLYISGHPLDEYKKSLAMQTSTTIEKIYKANDILKESISSEMLEETFIDATINDNDKVILGGIIIELKQKVTKNNKMMAFLKLEDLTGTIEVIVFPRTLDKLREQIKDDSLVRIQGRVNLKEDEMPKLICENIEGLEKVNDSKLYIKAKDKKNVLEISSKLKTLIKGYEGNTPIYVFADEERQSFRMTNDKWVELEEGLIDILKQKFGDENIKIVD